MIAVGLTVIVARAVVAANIKRAVAGEQERGYRGQRDQHHHRAERKDGAEDRRTLPVTRRDQSRSARPPTRSAPQIVAHDDEQRATVTTVISTVDRVTVAVPGPSGLRASRPDARVGHGVGVAGIGPVRGPRGPTIGRVRCVVEPARRESDRCPPHVVRSPASRHSAISVAVSAYGVTWRSLAPGTD
ncbi:hypothetical protein HBB16_15010 [Pseudonocardia sp. MCCB 268]|nr:hypothetical protein [Pseudonocardia cytotoxica]